MSSAKKLPTVSMKADAPAPEGIYPAVLKDLTMESDYLRFEFRLCEKGLDNPFVNGICETALNKSSKLMRWLNALCGLEFEEHRKVDLEALRLDVIDANCFVKVKHREKNERNFVNVTHVFSHKEDIESLKGEFA